MTSNVMNDKKTTDRICVWYCNHFVNIAVGFYGVKVSMYMGYFLKEIVIERTT